MRKILFLFLCAVLFSCSNSDEEQNVPVGFLKQVSSYGMAGVDTYNYFYNGNKISKITSNYNVMKFIYTGDLITEINGYDLNSNLISKTTYQYNSNNDVVSSLRLNYDNNYGFRNELTYNNDGTILINYYSGNLTTQNTFSSSGLYHLANNEIISSEETSASDLVISNYEYDSNNTPMNQVIGFSKLNILKYSGVSLLPFLFNGITHNCKKVTNEGLNIDCPTVEYIISYNSNNCPEWLQLDESTNSCSDLPSFHYVYQQ